MFDKSAIANSFSAQARWCDVLGSPFTGTFLRMAAADIEAGDLYDELFSEWRVDPRESALPLRFAGALHFLVLSGREPTLAPLYPYQSDRTNADQLWSVMRRAIQSHRDVMDDFLDRSVQTNEVGRSRFLIGGFLECAKETGWPLRILEIGSSGGLNLNADLYRYEFDKARWGPAESDVVLTGEWTGPPPAIDAPLGVVAKAGCDIDPVDLSNDDNVLRLLSYIWPEQSTRQQRFKNAVRIWRRRPVAIQRENAARWLKEQLSNLPAETTSVIYHSVMWQYMSTSEQKAVRDVIEQAGSLAERRTPLVWLRMEPSSGGDGPFPLTYTLWPEGRERVLGYSHPHGQSIAWGP